MMEHEVQADHTFTYQETPLTESFMPHRLRLYAGEVTAYRIDISTNDRWKREPAVAVRFSASNRIGIRWGEQTTWFQSTGNIQKDIELWLNYPDAFQP